MVRHSRMCTLKLDRMKNVIAQLSAFGGSSWTLVELRPHAFCELAALQVPENCLICPHFLQTPRLAASIIQ